MRRNVQTLVRSGIAGIGHSLRRAYPALLLVLFALINGMFALRLSAESYAATVDTAEKMRSYWANPALTLLNMLPPLLLTMLGWFLTRRAWAAYLLSAVPTFLLAAAQYYKAALRGEPLLASDLKLIRTAGGIVGRYTLEPTESVVAALMFAVAMLLCSVFVLRRNRGRGRARLIGLLVCLAAAPILFEACYLSDACYEATENADYITENSDNELYASRGVWYSFLHSIPDALPAKPPGYNRWAAEATIGRYRDADIPAEQKVQVVGVMLEAFCDLTDYPMLAKHDGVAAVYAPFHALETRSVSGDIFTNIFAGGTVETEWNFLTGYSHHEDFTADLDTYVRYFNAQGYDTVFHHPGYSWFYDRRTINGYLGFDESVFSEDGFSDVVDPELAPYRSDAELFDWLFDELRQRKKTDAPLFSFSVTYQNHGPYGSELFDGAVVTPQNSGWSRETCGILSHYLYGLKNTIEELLRFTEELETLDEPVVLVLFGDHKPWLGNEKSVYTELGVDLDLSEEQGFRNVYAMPYLIWANHAAKQTLGKPFTGSGDDFSACYLMEKLFDCCGWDGPAFMQLARDMRARLPLVHWRGYFLSDGKYLTKEELSSDVLSFYQNYRSVEYLREKYGLNP